MANIDAIYKDVLRLYEIAAPLNKVTSEVEAPFDMGLTAFRDLLYKVRANSEFMANAHSVAILNLTKATDEVAKLREKYQDAYDEAVAKGVASLGHASWEERASIFRVQNIDAAKELRQAERKLELIKGIVDAIKVLSQSMQRARGDLTPLVDIIQFGERVGEF